MGMTKSSPMGVLKIWILIASYSGLFLEVQSVDFIIFVKCSVT